MLNVVAMEVMFLIRTVGGLSVEKVQDPVLLHTHAQSSSLTLFYGFFAYCVLESPVVYTGFISHDCNNTFLGTNTPNWSIICAYSSYPGVTGLGRGQMRWHSL